MASKPFIPSSWHLQQQIAAAEAKFDAARERQRQERAERRAIRAVQRATARRLYAFIQGVDPRV